VPAQITPPCIPFHRATVERADGRQLCAGQMAASILVDSIVGNRLDRDSCLEFPLEAAEGTTTARGAAVDHDRVAGRDRRQSDVICRLSWPGLITSLYVRKRHLVLP
jgi:hypothetical protein